MSMISRLRLSLPDEGAASRAELVQYLREVLEHNTVMRPEKAYLTTERLASNVLFSILHGLDIEQEPPSAPDDCRRCHGEPPFGFTCNTCGKIGER